MSEETTEIASSPENQETDSQVVDSAATEEQSPGETQTVETTETGTPGKPEEASESTQQALERKLEKAQKAAANANIKARKAERANRQRDAAKVQESTKPAEPEAKVPEDLLYDQEQTAGYIKSTVDTAILKDRKKQDEIRQVEAENQELESFWEKSDKLAEVDEEYSELVDSSDDVQLSGILKGRIFKSEVGAKLHKHVLANPDVLLKINNLSTQYPTAADDAIAKIEASLTNQSQGQQTIKETKAPKPIDTVGGGSGPVLSSASAGSMDEYYARRMAEKKAAGVGSS